MAVYSKFIASNAHRITKYLNNEDMEQKYKWDCLKFPVTLSNIPKFEKINIISINVFGLERSLEEKSLRLPDKSD
jgi:hypothetical protein